MHREHIDKGDDIPVCKVSYDSHTAKEMLLMAPNLEQQKVRHRHQNKDLFHLFFIFFFLQIFFFFYVYGWGIWLNSCFSPILFLPLEGTYLRMLTKSNLVVSHDKVMSSPIIYFCEWYCWTLKYYFVLSFNIKILDYLRLLVSSFTFFVLQYWVVRLSKIIQRSGYKANNAPGADGARISPR